MADPQAGNVGDAVAQHGPSLPRPAIGANPAAPANRRSGSARRQARSGAERSTSWTSDSSGWGGWAGAWPPASRGRATGSGPGTARPEAAQGIDGRHPGGERRRGLRRRGGDHHAGRRRGPGGRDRGRRPARPAGAPGPAYRHEHDLGGAGQAARRRARARGRPLHLGAGFRAAGRGRGRQAQHRGGGRAGPDRARGAAPRRHGCQDLARSASDPSGPTPSSSPATSC